MKGKDRKIIISRPYSLWLLLLVAVVMIFKFMSHADNPNRAHYFAKHYWHYNNLKPELNEALHVIQLVGSDAKYSQFDANGMVPEEAGTARKIIYAEYNYYPAKPVKQIDSPIELESSSHWYRFFGRDLISKNYPKSTSYALDTSQYDGQEIYGFKKTQTIIFDLSYPGQGQSLAESTIDSELEFFTQPQYFKQECKIKQQWHLEIFPTDNGRNLLSVNACQRLVVIMVSDKNWQIMDELNLLSTLQFDFSETFSDYYVADELGVLAWSSNVFKYLIDPESEINWQLLQSFPNRKKKPYDGIVYGMSLRQSEIQKGQRDYRLSWAPYNFFLMLILNYILIQSYIRRRVGRPWMKEAFRYMGRDFRAIIFWLPLSVISLIRAWQDFGQNRRKQKVLARQAALEHQERELGLEVLRQNKKKKKKLNKVCVCRKKRKKLTHILMS